MVMVFLGGLLLMHHRNFAFRITHSRFCRGFSLRFLFHHRFLMISAQASHGWTANGIGNAGNGA